MLINNKGHTTLTNSDRLSSIENYVIKSTTNIILNVVAMLLLQSCNVVVSAVFKYTNYIIVVEVVHTIENKCDLDL